LALQVSLLNLLYAGDAALSNENITAKKRHYSLNATSNSFELGTQESVLAWEKWHHRVCKLLAKHISHSIGQMMGKAVLHVKIDQNQNVTIELLQSTGKPEFGQKCLEGAQALNQDAALKFPDGSNRSSVNFDVNFKRSMFTIPGLKYRKDDYERLNE
jgi:hypothetical protein